MRMQSNDYHQALGGSNESQNDKAETQMYVSGELSQMGRDNNTGSVVLSQGDTGANANQ